MEAVEPSSQQPPLRGLRRKRIRDGGEGGVQRKRIRDGGEEKKNRRIIYIPYSISDNRRRRQYQSTQQLPPISGQVPPSSQAIPMPYVQASRPMSSGSLPPQQNAQVPNNVPNLPGAAMPLSSSYTAPNTVNAPVQYQAAAQVTPPGTQTWTTLGTQSVPLVTPLHQTAQQPLATAVTVSL